MALIVEILDPRTGEVRQRLRLGAFPAAVGRQLDNDLVLDDPYVDAHHARFVLDPDGSLVLEDLGSVNRLSTTFHAGAERVRCAPGAEVTVGRTRLRVRDDAATIPAALALGGASETDTARGWYERPAARAAAIVGAAALFSMSIWFTTSDRNGATLALTSALGLLMLLVIWGGVWAIAGRMVIGQFRLVAHLAIASWMIVLGLATGFVVGWIDFLVPDNGIAEGAEAIVLLAAAGIMISLHLAESTYLPRPRRIRAGAIVVGLVLLITGAFTLVEDDAFSDVAEFSSVIKSAPAGIVPKKSMAEFDSVILDLRADVDSLLAKPVKGEQPEK